MARALMASAEDAGIQVPAVGAVLMSISTIIVAMNAQLLRRVELRPKQDSARG